MATSIPHRPRETVASFVSRTAAAYHMDAATFSADRETSFLAVISGASTAIEALEAFGCPIPEDVVAWSPSKDGVAGTMRLFRGHTFPSKILQPPKMRGCPECIRQDLEDQGTGPAAMAMRGHWLVPHVTLCLEHNTPLMTLWQESKPVPRFASAPHLASLIPAITEGNLTLEPRAPTSFDTWLDAQLEGHGDGNWLEQHPLHAACNYCLMLGTSLLRHITSAPSAVTDEDKWFVYDLGFRSARQGEVAIRGALQGLQNLPGGPHDGPKKIFPKMYDRLAYDTIDNPDYDEFRRILRSHMLETWPLGVGDELLGEPIVERRLHSVRSAAKATGIDQRRLRKILAAENIIPEEGLPDAWQVFDAKRADTVLKAATTLITAKEFAEGINASRSQFDLLVAGGVLAPRLPSVHDAGTKTIWDPVDGVRFLDSVFIGASPLRQAQHGWEHISKSAARLMVGPEVIIRAIQDRRIVRIGNHADFDGYAALYVYHDEVCSVLSPEPSSHQSIELFSKTVGIGQPIRMKRLVINGHTPATELVHPKLKTKQLFITRDDADAFHRRFYTPRTMAQAHGKSWQSMTATLRAAGVTIFSPDGEDYGTLYLREDIDRTLS
ncbi:TniQ family protein [Sulfitobacter sp. 1A13353]|uniref:TniQ family protein n=1 Tax=Sulfitobacter sp. 1A13353 TaxID=3368568 RepID=UPI00374524AF